MTTTPNHDQPLTRDDGSPMYVGRHLPPAATGTGAPGWTPAVPAHLLHDVVEILQADADGNLHQLAPGHATYQLVGDGYGNQVRLRLREDGYLLADVRWAASDREEELVLDARGGATRIARTLLVLIDAPDDDSAL